MIHNSWSSQKLHKGLTADIFFYYILFYFFLFTLPWLKSAPVENADVSTDNVKQGKLATGLCHIYSVSLLEYTSLAILGHRSLLGLDMGLVPKIIVCYSALYVLLHYTRWCSALEFVVWALCASWGLKLQ
ncbi:hypothetical protein BKA67DRAFT_2354 [Truncatella angustata]|uniref:Uncharacterized protein n=1 Tax=Truncatella angustata TaxID=152316 RepID=A0A9P9A3H9_9PEZI|nr:uncharacterized protein BKA67DRAFT_2354 [Truncatella angustata]KAH6658954.1 hypothetical protein BKA67DRAFT_2354 [Truncatella angustata]